MPTVDDILANRKPKRWKVPILMDGDVEAALADIETEIQTARLTEARGGDLTSAVPALTERLRQLQTAARDATVVFEFVPIPERDFEALLGAHPPKPDQPDDLYNEDTFPPVLVAAACVSHDIDEAGAERLWSTLSRSETGALFDGAWAAQVERPSPFIAAAIGAIVDSAPSPTTPTPAESPDHGSSEVTTDGPTKTGGNSSHGSPNSPTDAPIAAPTNGNDATPTARR